MPLLQDAPTRVARATGTLLVLVSALALTPAAARAQRTPAPTGLEVTGTSAAATVTWQPVEGAVSYSVKRWKQDDLKCCNNSVADLTRTTWTDEGGRKEGFPQPGIYVFEVTAQLKGTSGVAVINWTLPAAATPALIAVAPVSIAAAPAPTAPVAGKAPVVGKAPPRELPPIGSLLPGPAPAPTGLTVTGTPVSATLAWQPVAGVVSYVVTRQQANAPATQQTLAPTNTGMHDSGLQPATAYTYTVRAIQSDGREASTEVLFTTPPALNPSGFTAMQMAEGTVKLTWQSVPNVSFYQLWGPGTPNTGISVTGTSQTVSGVPSGPQQWKIGSFYAPGPASTAATMFPTISLFVTTASLCAMAQPQVGWGPQYVDVIPGGQRGAALRWPPAYQAVAYTVERAVRGSGPYDRGAVEKITAWTVVGSTCSGSAFMFKRPTLAADGPVPAGYLGFLDISAGVVPGMEYVYRVKAFDASGKVGWQPRWWWAPNPGGLRFDTVSINGRTVTLTLATDWATSRPPNEMSITTSYGYSSLPEPIVVTPTYRWTTQLLSVPAGTHTITVTARWTIVWDGTLPRVVDWRTGSREITVNP